MATKNNPGPNDCYMNAMPDEPMFTLLARDLSAPDLVRRWAAVRNDEIALGRHPLSDVAVIQEALACADAMNAWRKSNAGIWRKNYGKKDQ